MQDLIRRHPERSEGTSQFIIQLYYLLTGPFDTSGGQKLYHINDPMNKYFIYILANSQRSSFYVGITDRLKYRLEEHKSNKIDGYPIKYKCRYLIFTEQRSDEQAAIARHTEINGWKKTRQVELILEKNPKLNEMELGY